MLIGTLQTRHAGSERYYLPIGNLVSANRAWLANYALELLGEQADHDNTEAKVCYACSTSEQYEDDSH
jgi:hypothetical protein